MIVWVSAPVLVLSPLGLAWIFTRKNRILGLNKNLTKEEIIERIHKGELERIENFAPRDTTKDVLATDAEFWERIGGFAGLIREYENAVCCVQLCQLYVRDSNMDKQDMEYAIQGAFDIKFLIIRSVGEEFWRRIYRLFGRKVPHICARGIVCLYFELATQTNLLNLEYGTGHLAL